MIAYPQVYLFYSFEKSKINLFSISFLIQFVMFSAPAGTQDNQTQKSPVPLTVKNITPYNRKNISISIGQTVIYPPIHWKERRIEN